MYHDIVEHGDKVAIIMDKRDLHLLVYLLGRQYGGAGGPYHLLTNGYHALAKRCDATFDEGAYSLDRNSTSPDAGWKIVGGV